MNPSEIPLTECLKDVVIRVIPYWKESIIPELEAGKTVLVVAHGNSLRALIKHLESSYVKMERDYLKAYSIFDREIEKIWPRLKKMI